MWITVYFSLIISYYFIIYIFHLYYAQPLRQGMMNSVWHACSRCEKLGPHLLNHKQPENTWLNTYFVVIKSNYCYVVTKTWGANTQVKHVWIPFSRAFVQIPFSRNWGPDPFFKGSGAPWPGDSLFQGFFGLVQHKLAHCICKWPEGWTFMVFATSLDWVALQPPGAGLFDDIWLVIKDGLCLKPASPVHLPSKPRRVQMHLWLFTFFKVSGGSSSWICFRVESYLAWEPTHEMMWTSASNIRVSRALCSLFQRGIVPVHHHNMFEGFLFLFQGCGGCPRGGGGWDILFQGCVLGLFQGTGWVCLQSLASCLVSLSLRACSLAASSALLSLALLWDLDLGPFLPLLGKALSRSSSAFFKAASSSFKASFFCFSCSSADAWAFFKASSFSSKLSGEVQGGVSLGQRSPLHPLPSFPPGLGRWCQRQRPWTCCSFQNLTFSSLVPLVFSNQFSWPFSWPFWQAFSSPGCLPFSKQLFQQLFQVVGFRLFQAWNAKGTTTEESDLLVCCCGSAKWPSCMT